MEVDNAIIWVRVIRRGQARGKVAREHTLAASCMRRRRICSRQWCTQDGRRGFRTAGSGPLNWSAARDAPARDAIALAGLSSAVALIRGSTPERQAYPRLYDALIVLIEAMPHTDIWPALYTRFELGLLSALGYGLDLTRCAVTGETEGLAWVSPRTGRAATAEAGAPHADVLLRLPPFLVDRAELQSGDVADAFIGRAFLERRV